MPDEKMKTIKVPDGRGGMREAPVEHEHRGGTADQTKAEAARAKVEEASFWKRVGHATEAYNSFHKIYATDHELTPEEEAAAVYLDLLNIREFFPKELGGTERYDELCKVVWTWFEQNKNS
jgi:hypothetical protein